MTRLVWPVVILLLMLLTGAAWSLFGPLHIREFLRATTTESPRPTVQAPASKAKPSAANTKEQAQSAPGENLPAEFDIARIDPEGTSVFAGRTVPRATVTVLGDGREIGTAQADENGEWTMAVDHKFANNDPDLAIVASRPSQSKGPPKKQGEVAGRGAAKDAPTPAVSDQDATTAPQDDSGSQTEPRARPSARTVTSNLLDNLKDLVETARTAAVQQATTDPNSTVPAQADDTAPVTIAVVDTSPTVAAASSSPTLQPARGSATEATALSTGPQLPAPLARKTIPVPITFVFNESTLTEDGRKAAALLLEYLRIKKFPKISLTGHADERGSDELNLALSRERLATVERFLKDSGFVGELELVPKGESEPFSGVERGDYELEELYQLDRRVELIITR